jgi:hypothetical protein
MPKYVLFLHSKASYPLPFYPIGTTYALNWSWHYELHEDVLGFMWVALYKLAGLKAHSDHQNPKKVALHGKTAYVGLHS